MRLALIADTFPPHRNSGAVQLRDLSREFVRQGHDLTVMLPAAGLVEGWCIEEMDGIRILRLSAPRTKEVNRIRRTLAEIAMPFAMYRQYKKSRLISKTWDGIVWYSPSIFHGPLVGALKRENNCKSYLVIRDIFPDWAVDMGLMGRGPSYRFFQAIARYQYSVADVIGVQTQGNLSYFKYWQEQHPSRALEILPNWLGQAGAMRCPIRIGESALSGRKIFVYAGNMGVAQNMDAIIDLASHLCHRTDIGFVLVGRGSEAARLRRQVHSRGLDNTLFFDEIDPDEIPDLYGQCHIGIVSLDPRHRSHNIPGKFLTYMQSGLPVLANVNPGNDLADIIRSWRVGEVCDSGSLSELVTMAERLASDPQNKSCIAERCKSLFTEKYAVAATVRDISRHFRKHS